MINIITKTKLPIMYGFMFFIIQSIIEKIIQKQNIQEKKNSQMHVNIISLLHAIISSYGAINVLLYPGKYFYSDKIYGNSDEVVNYINISLGFFLWDIYICFKYNYDIPFKLHGILCAILYTIALLPFMQHILELAFLFEISSVFLQIRNICIILNYTQGKFLKIINYLFATSFLIIRILIGIPVTITCVSIPLYWELQNNNYKQKGISIYLIYFIIISTNMLNTLNIYWITQIIKKLKIKNK